MMSWHFPEVTKESIPDNYPWWGYAISFITAFMLVEALLLCVDEKSITSDLFTIISCFILAPLSGSLALVCTIYSFYFDRQFKANFRNSFIDVKRYEWQTWTRSTLWLIDYSQLTPVADLGLKIAGIEGHAELNPDRVISIEHIDSSLHLRKTNGLNILLAPLASRLDNGWHPIELYVYLGGGSEKENRALLEQSLKFHNIVCFRDESIHWLDSCPDLELMDQWIDDRRTKDRLLICLSVNEENHDSSEVGVALLFSHTNVAKKNANLRVFRPMKASKFELIDLFPRFIYSGQVVSDSVKRLWSVGLDKIVANVVNTSAIENGLTFAAGSHHQMDLYVGKANGVHAWLALTCAADACRHGLGGQLVAQQHEENVCFVQLHHQRKPLGAAEPVLPMYYPVIHIVGVFFAFLCLFFAFFDKAMAFSLFAFFTSILLLFILLLAAQAVVMWHYWRGNCLSDWEELNMRSRD